MSTSGDYVRFLTARWDEIEAAALAGISGQADPENGWGLEEHPLVSGWILSPHVGKIHERAQGEHIIMHHPQAVLDDIAAKRKILEWHENWPVLTETRPAPSASEDFDVDGLKINSMTIKMSREFAWLTEREYAARFGSEPPTSPILRMLAEPFRDHPEHPDAQAL